jgi:hypothetical protein
MAAAHFQRKGENMSTDLSLRKDPDIQQVVVKRVARRLSETEQERKRYRTLQEIQMQQMAAQQQCIWPPVGGDLERALRETSGSRIGI